MSTKNILPIESNLQNDSNKTLKKTVLHNLNILHCCSTVCQLLHPKDVPHDKNDKGAQSITIKKSIYCINLFITCKCLTQQIMHQNKSDLNLVHESVCSYVDTCMREVSPHVQTRMWTWTCMKVQIQVSS